jgi:hypothetical protein
MPACPKFRFFPGAVGSQTRFPSDLAFARLVRRHVRRAVCPSTASTPAAGGLKTKKNSGYPLGREAGYGMGTGCAVSGLPSGPHRPLPRLCIAQAWLDGAALGGAPRPSAGRQCAHPRRRTAGHPGARLQVGPLCGRVGAGPNRRRVGAGQCRRQCRRRPQLQCTVLDAAALRCRLGPRRRNGRAARRRRGRVHPGPPRVTPCRAAHGRSASGRPPPVSCRMTAEQLAQDRSRVRAYAAAMAQAPTFRALFRRIFATASCAATALLLVRSCARASMCRARRARPAAAVGTLVRVGCCAAPASTARADQPVSWTRARYLTMHCECAFPPTQPNLARGVAGPTSHRGDEGGAFPRTARRGARWRPRVHTGVPVASEPPAARAPFGGLFVSENNFRAFPAVKQKLHGMTENRYVRSSRRSSATLPRRRWSRTSRRRTSTPRLSTFCCASRCGAADVPPCPLWAAARSPGVVRWREYSSTPGVP